MINNKLNRLELSKMELMEVDKIEIEMLMNKIMYTLYKKANVFTRAINIQVYEGDRYLIKLIHRKGSKYYKTKYDLVLGNESNRSDIIVNNLLESLRAL